LLIGVLTAIFRIAYKILAFFTRCALPIKDVRGFSANIEALMWSCKGRLAPLHLGYCCRSDGFENLRSGPETGQLQRKGEPSLGQLTLGIAI
jgi:hypothetical protein